jgi:biopolymer transport protein ExbB
MLFDQLNSVLEKALAGGWVTFCILLVFLAIAYVLSYRYFILNPGKTFSPRQSFRRRDNLVESESFQADYLRQLDLLDEHVDSEKLSEALLIEKKEDVRRYSVLLKICVILAPLLGLLGTVIGMIETFSSLSNSQLFSQSGGIAGGISKALLTTQQGLLVSIPGLLGMHYLGRIEKKTLSDLVQLREMFLGARYA